MAGHFTKRNHYNPCFWTALWNKDYFRALRDGKAPVGPAREQQVYALTVKSGKVVHTCVGKLHFEKDLGVAEITPESIVNFTSRHDPSELQALQDYLREHPENVYLDFEDVLHGLETKGHYDSLIEAARLGDFTSSVHKGFVTCVAVVHAMRSLEMMRVMIDSFRSIGVPKWEYFWLLKRAWGSPPALLPAASALALGRWTLYRTPEDAFPLCDSPVMVDRHGLMVTVSPRLLIEINVRDRSREDAWTLVDGIKRTKYADFRRRALANSYRQIIFSDPDLLAAWGAAPDFRRRSQLLADPLTEAEAFSEAVTRVRSLLSGFERPLVGRGLPH